VDNNLQDSIDHQRHLNDLALQHLAGKGSLKDPAQWHTAFHDYDQQLQWMKDLATRHSDIVTLFTIGKAWSW
jgi:hypothetical protein